MDWNSKWNYQASFIGNVPSELEAVFNIAQINESYQVNKLAFTKFEEEAINRVINLVNLLLYKLNFKAIEISPFQIIIVEEIEFIEKIAQSRGLSKFGYVYLSRDEKNWRFLRSLIHEVSHLISFYSLEVKEENNTILVDLNKTGFYYKEKNSYYFHAFNEAATEFFADKIMYYILSSDLLMDKEKKALQSFTNYLPEKIFFEELINLFNDSNKFWNTLFKSYLSGEVAIFRMLEEEFPEIYMDIKNLKAGEEENLKKLARKQDPILLENLERRISEYEEI